MYSSPDKPIDEQVIRINASRSVSGLPHLTVHQPDPTRVNVFFYINNANQTMISGPSTPGEDHLQKIPDRIATDRDKKLFAFQYHAFLENQDQLRTGTLLDIIFPHDKAKIQRYYKANIYNVEQLADVNEAVIAAHPEISPEDKKTAQRYMRYKLYEKELMAKDETIARLEAEIRELKTELSEQPRNRPRIKS